MAVLTHNRTQKIIIIAIELLVLVLFFALNIVPILWGVLTSFKNPRDIAAFPPKIINFIPVLDHYRTVIAGGLFNSTYDKSKSRTITS